MVGRRLNKQTGNEYLATVHICLLFLQRQKSLLAEDRMPLTYYTILHMHDVD